MCVCTWTCVHVMEKYKRTTWSTQKESAVRKTENIYWNVLPSIYICFTKNKIWKKKRTVVSKHWLYIKQTPYAKHFISGKQWSKWLKQSRRLLGCYVLCTFLIFKAYQDIANNILVTQMFVFFMALSIWENKWQSFNGLRDNHLM